MRGLFAIAAVAVLLRGPACPAAGEEEPRRATEPAPAGYKFPAYVPITERPELPRVLLLGDSISIGYTLPVRARLAGRANVLRPPENCADTGVGLERLATWLELGNGRWDVIHFNFGLHDIKYLDAEGRYVRPEKGRQVTPLPRYEQQLRAIVARLKRTGARLIFATTTPVPDGASGRIPSDAADFNRVALAVMRDEAVEVNDLCALVTPRQTAIQQPRNVHFTAEGYEQLAEAVTAHIEQTLPSRPRG